MSEDHEMGEAIRCKECKQVIWPTIYQLDPEVCQRCQEADDGGVYCEYGQ